MSHPVVRSLQHPEKPQDHDEAMLRSFAEAGAEEDALRQARGVGIAWPVIIQLLLQFGPNFTEILKLVLASRKVKPPEPVEPTDPEVKPEEPAQAKRRHRKRGESVILSPAGTPLPRGDAGFKDPDLEPREPRAELQKEENPNDQREAPARED